MKEKPAEGGVNFWLLAAVVWYAAAAVNFFSDGENGILCMCLGSAFLCLGVSRNQKPED